MALSINLPRVARCGLSFADAGVDSAKPWGDDIVYFEHRFSVEWYGRYNHNKSEKQQSKKEDV